jgi:hypothetical protein
VIIGNIGEYIDHPDQHIGHQRTHGTDQQRHPAQQQNSPVRGEIGKLYMIVCFCHTYKYLHNSKLLPVLELPLVSRMLSMRNFTF